MNAGQLNRKVVLETWEYSQDTQGNSFGTVSETWEQRAKVEDRSGRSFELAAQEQWNYDSKITVRVTSKEITANNTLLYEGWRYKITAANIDTEGKKRWYVLRCIKSEVWEASS